MRTAAPVCTSLRVTRVAPARDFQRSGGGDKGGARKNKGGWGGSCLDDGAAAVEVLAVDVLPHAPAVVLSVIAAYHAAVIVAAASSAKPAAPATARAAAIGSAPASSVTAASETHDTIGDSLGEIYGMVQRIMLSKRTQVNITRGG